jgi:predicted GTPase
MMEEQEKFWEELFAGLKDELSKLNDDFEKNFIKPNIVLSGKTGVGKSTLINAIFGFDYAEVGSGKPVSKSLEEYNFPNTPINLFDTRGIELDISKREESRKDIINEINKRASSSDVENHMHVMWYCISNEGRRIEDVEIEWIRDFAVYMPVIIVLTQTLDSNEVFQKDIEKEFPSLKICRILAKERELYQGIKIPTHGLKNLVSETIKILPDATVRAFTAAQKIKIEEKIDSAKKLIEERLDSRNPLNYKNLAHVADTLPVGLDVLGKGAVYLYIAKDIMTVMGIPVTKSFFKFAKEAKPLIDSIVLPFLLFEGSKTAGKVAFKYRGEELGKKVLAYITNLIGNTKGREKLVLSPVVGFIFGAFNRKVTEKIANGFIEVCSDFLRNEVNYEELENEEILDILSKNMKEKMEGMKESMETLVEEDLVINN